MKSIKIRILQYEYWPYWLFYSPFVFFWLWQSLKSGSFSYFCKVNPGIEFGGFLDYSKFRIMNQIPETYKPETLYIKDKDCIQEIPEFPFILKPDFGERGTNVELIQSDKDWEKYPLKKNLILQKYIDYPMEFGVFFVKLNPNGGEILSITGKEFLRFKGDGKTSFSEFVLQHPRAKNREKYLKKKFQAVWNTILKYEEEILVEPIGNHNRGTRFFDASHLITNELSHRINQIAQNINGFHYGRFDVKAKSAKDFKNGEFIILEVNGANSEPTHIYDSKYNLGSAYKEVTRHLDYQYEIAKKQPKTYSSRRFYKAVLKRIFKTIANFGR